MSGNPPFERVHESLLNAAAEEVWQSVTTFEGINAELMPFASMRSVGGIPSLQRALGPDNTAAFDVTLRMFGLLPLQTSQLRIVEWSDMRFVEQSKQPAMATWQHERTVEPAPGGSRLVDRLTFQPAFLPGVVAGAIDILFRHRHRQLARRWNADEKR